MKKPASPIAWRSLMLMRCCTTVTALLLWSIALVGASYGQGGPPFPPQGAQDGQAVAILAQCAAAMGTHQLRDSYSTWSITPADPRQQPSTVVSKTKGAELVRHDVTDAGGTFTSVIRYGHGSRVKAGQKSALPVALTSYYIPEHVPALACAVNLSRPSMNVRYVGVEQLGSRSAHHVVFEARNPNPDLADISQLISEFHLYIDTETFVVLKSMHYVFSPEGVENRSQWEDYFDDYRAVSGVLMPFHITRYVSGQKFSDLVCNNMQVNIGIPDSDFEQ